MEKQESRFFFSDHSFEKMGYYIRRGSEEDLALYSRSNPGGVQLGGDVWRGTEGVQQHSRMSKHRGEGLPGPADHSGLYGLYGQKLSESLQLLWCIQCITVCSSHSWYGHHSPLIADVITSQHISHSNADIPLAPYVWCHCGIRTDSTPTLCSSAKRSHTGETIALKAGTRGRWRKAWPHNRIWRWRRYSRHGTA